MISAPPGGGGTPSLVLLITGKTGPQGEKGSKGDGGLIGPKGETGAKGDKGDVGHPGKDCVGMAVISGRSEGVGPQIL